MEQQVKEPEVWKDIPDYEGLYQVSSYGRIKRSSYLREHYSGKKVTYKARILQNSVHRDGYIKVQLYKNNIPKDFQLHRIVAEVFNDKKHKCNNVNHLDEIKTNNYFRNLEWVTVRENKTYSIDKTSTSSKFTGVTLKGNKNSNKPWYADISINGKKKYLGYYHTEEEAHQAYLTALKEHGLKNKYAT